jgi:beta-lactamase regulating signal transducer with metallopeptidase domain
MITGIPAVVINMMTIMALGIFLSVIVVSVYFKYNAQKHKNYSAKTYQNVLWSLVALPWIMGITAAVLLAFFDSELSSMQNIIPGIHWHHIDEFNIQSWHGALGAFVVCFVVYALFKSALNLFNNIQKIKVLKSLATLESDNTYLLDTDSPMAFVGGYLNPQVFITTGMKKALNKDELEIVLLHEYEHLNSKDSLKKLLFRLLSSAYLRDTSIKLQSAMNLAIEQCADSAITSEITDKSKIAETLLKVKSLLKKSKDSTMEQSAICHYAVDEIEQRIRYLLLPEPKKAFPALLIATVVPILAFSCTYFAASAHHLIEQILS